MRFPRSHPALAGHFPGNPIVPGAVLLAAVAHALPGFLGVPARVTGMPAVKFLAPLPPEVDVQIVFSARGAGRVAFIIEAAGEKIAGGSLSYD